MDEERTLDTEQEETGQEAPQEAQEAPVAAETDAGEEVDTPEQEAAQEPENAPESGEQAAPMLGTGSGRLGGGLAAPAVITPSPVLLATGNATAETQESDEEYETLLVNELDVVKLGRQGEHLTQQVVIDCTAWLDRLPGCTLLIAAIRPCENVVYLPTVSVADGVITWEIRDQDTANGGWGRGEVRAMLDGKIKKSAVFRTRVEPSLEGSATIPATPPDWVQEILGSVAAAQAAAEAAATLATTAADQAAAAAQSAAAAAENTAGLRGWSLTKEQDDTVSIDYNEE